MNLYGWYAGQYVRNEFKAMYGPATRKNMWTVLESFVNRKYRMKKKTDDNERGRENFKPTKKWLKKNSYDVLKMKILCKKCNEHLQTGESVVCKDCA